MKKPKYIWTNSKGEQVDIDSIQDIEYLRNITKMVLRNCDSATDYLETIKNKISVKDSIEQRFLEEQERDWYDEDQFPY